MTTRAQLGDVEAIFAAFVARANAPDDDDAIGALGPPPSAPTRAIAAPAGFFEEATDITHARVPPEVEARLSDMAVLLRYGHAAHVERELDAILGEHPRSVDVLRRVANFYLEVGEIEAGITQLFRLATLLFEERKFSQMREALHTLLAHEPRNPRAHKLLSLLDRR